MNNPFVGLRPYESEDSLYYFGRNEQTKTLLRKLYNHRFVAVVGSSGSGKSSLIRAGVIPQLEAGFLIQDRDQWLIAAMKPGDVPLNHLVETLITSQKTTYTPTYTTESLLKAIQEQGSQALVDYLKTRFETDGHDNDTNLFILVDQFEELFRFGNDTVNKKSPNNSDHESQTTHKQNRQQAEEFVALLLNLTQQTELPVYICLTMRSDFLGDCDAFTGLPEAINISQFLVPRLTRNQRREVITSPVHLARATISPRLVDRLLNEDIHTRDDLPVLQHALMRTFDAWQQNKVTHEDDKDLQDTNNSNKNNNENKNENNNPIDIQHYEYIHTLHKALDSHANEALEELNKNQKNIAKKLFQSLTTVDSGNRRIRRPAHLNEVCAIAKASPEAVMEVINIFRKDNRSFLVVSSETINNNPLIDISHESLIRQWQQLAEWVDEEATSAKTYRRLAETALLHQHQLANYYRDLDLEQALFWKEDNHPTQTWANRYDKNYALAMAFLKESDRDHQQREHQRQAEQQKQQRLLQEKAELEEQKRLSAEQQAKEQRKALVKLRWLSGIMAVLTLIMLVVANMAWHYSKESDEAATQAKNATELAVQSENRANAAKDQAEKNEKIAEKAKNKALAATKETQEKILEANFYLAKSYEQKAMFALSKGDRAQEKGRNKSITEYQKAWLYALEAEKLPLPKDKIALKPASLVKLTNLSARAISPERKPTPPLTSAQASMLLPIVLMARYSLPLLTIKPFVFGITISLLP